MAIESRSTAKIAQLVRSSSSAKWIVKGRILMIKSRVLNVAKDCQVVFSPERLTSSTTDDRVESVEFWFRYPIAGGVLYLFNGQTCLLEPADGVSDRLQAPPSSHQQWLIRYTGTTGRAIRRLYEQL